MRDITVFSIFLLILTPFYPSKTAGVRTADGYFNITDNGKENNNRTDSPPRLFDGRPSRENSKNLNLTEDLFWALPDPNDTTETVSGSQRDSEETETQMTILETLNDTTNSDSAQFLRPPDATVAQTQKQDSSNDMFYNETNIFPTTMDETIMLQRNNCNLEITVQETHDLRVEIRFGKLQNKTSGKCCITLNGEKNSTLAVFISNIHLCQNHSHEVLKVITANFGLDFVLQEYNSWDKYEPLLLTETNRVYIILQYEAQNALPNEQDSYFNLEVFNYHKYKNDNHRNSYHQSYKFI